VIAMISQSHPGLRRLGAGCLLALTLALKHAPLKAEPNAAGQAALISSKHGLQQTDVASSNVATRQEALLWTLLALNLLEPDFQHHVSRLAHAQLVLLSEDEIKMSGAGPLVGRLIIQNIIIPYLNRR
jgi:hypothetical protein